MFALGPFQIMSTFCWLELLLIGFASNSEQQEQALDDYSIEASSWPLLSKQVSSGLAPYKELLIKDNREPEKQELFKYGPKSINNILGYEYLDNWSDQDENENEHENQFEKKSEQNSDSTNDANDQEVMVVKRSKNSNKNNKRQARRLSGFIPMRGRRFDYINDEQLRSILEELEEGALGDGGAFGASQEQQKQANLARIIHKQSLSGNKNSFAGINSKLDKHNSGSAAQWHPGNLMRMLMTMEPAKFRRAFHPMRGKRIPVGLKQHQQHSQT